MKEYVLPIIECVGLCTEHHMMDTSRIPVGGNGGFDGGNGATGDNEDRIPVGGSGGFDTRAQEWDCGWE